MQCQNCKVQLPETAKFCTNCGAKIDVRLCPNGHVIEPDEKECRYCPSPKGSDANRMSVSANIEKGTTIDKPSEKMTVIENIPLNNSGKTSIFSDAIESQNPSLETSALFGWLVIIEGKDLWKDFPIVKTKLSIGRAADCDIILDDEHLSSQHASLKLKDNALFITDLDSSNGTYVNAQEITRVALSDNDIIKIGNTSLKFKLF